MEKQTETTQVTEIQSPADVQLEKIKQAFAPKIAEREALNEIYKGLIVAEITPDICDQAGELRKKLMKVRTGIAGVHKTQKAFYLSVGRTVDQWKNKETLPITQMEDNLAELENFYIRQKAAELKKLYEQRSKILGSYVCEPNLYMPEKLSEQAFENLVSALKLQKQAKIDAEKAEAIRVENERIAAEKLAAKQEAERLENERLQAIERKRIETENAKLKAEKLEAEKQAKIKAAKQKKEQEAIQAQHRKEKAAEAAKAAEKLEKLAAKNKALEEAAKIEAEKQAKLKAEKEAEKQAELNKGDADKVADLMADLEALKAKYIFKSAANKKMFVGVCTMLSKIIGYVKS